MNKKELERKENHERELVYYDTFIKAWVQNRLETNKQLITLSVLAIGLLVSVFGKPDSPLESLIWIFACSSFILCIITELGVFHRNTKYIEVELQRYSEENKKNPSQEILDYLENEIDKKLKTLRCFYCISSNAFATGIACTVVGASLAQIQYLLDIKQRILYILDILLNLA